LVSLEASPRSQEAPTPEDSTRLHALLQAVWKAGGQERPGLARGSPELAWFRAQVGPFFWKSAFLRRCYEKPRGYAGDYLMMEALYQRTPVGATPFERWMDTWGLELPSSQATRNAREALCALLLEEHRRGARRVLNVASGAAPELVAVVPAVTFDSVVLLDQDQGALDAALGAFHRARALPTTRPERLRLWCGSVLALLRDKSVLEPESLDLIYSTGLYEHLSERFARHLTQKLWSALAPGGLLVLGNAGGGHPSWPLTEAVMDWYLVHRTPEALLRLLEGLPRVASAEVGTEPAGLVHLLRVRKAP
jgi:SAM-dependent methyltransferase